MACACECADCSQVTLQTVWGGCNLIYNQLYCLQLNLPLTVWSGCDFSWILLHRYICWPMWLVFNFIIVFQILYASIVLFSDTCYVGLVPAVFWMVTHPTRWDFSTLYTTCSWDLQVCMYWLERICGFANYKVDSAGRSCVEIHSLYGYNINILTPYMIG